MEKTNKTPVILTGILSAIFILMLLLTIDTMTNKDSNESVEALVENTSHQLDINDPDRLIENEIGNNFFLNEYMSSVSDYFEYESVTVVYNQSTFDNQISLTVTDESYGKFMAEYTIAQGDDRDIFVGGIIDNIVDSTELLSTNLKGNIIIELTTPSMPDSVFMRLNNSELDFSITRYFLF